VMCRQVFEFFNQMCQEVFDRWWNKTKIRRESSHTITKKRHRPFLVKEHQPQTGAFLRMLTGNDPEVETLLKGHFSQSAPLTHLTTASMVRLTSAMCFLVAIFQLIFKKCAKRLILVKNRVADFSQCL